MCRLCEQAAPISRKDAIRIARAAGVDISSLPADYEPYGKPPDGYALALGKPPESIAPPMTDDKPWYSPSHKPANPRQRKAGEEIWRLREPGTGRVMGCEVFNHADVGGGFDLMLLMDGELLHSRRFVYRSEAMNVAEMMRTDQTRAGWTSDK